ncbi:MAG: glutathionylspermidine synthase family protein [Clostridiales bacterium]|nr:glutathionylspermidine synthase family protein [Clostridiales bacterium]
MIYPGQYYNGLVEADMKESAKSAKEYYKDMKNSTAWSHGYLVHTLYIPKMFDEEMDSYFKENAKIMYSILDKVIKQYEQNPKYRELFGFDKRLEELILRPKAYSCRIPIARLDIFFNEDDYTFKFCEFNTDGTSAMNEDREMNACLAKTAAFKKFKKRFNVRTYELFKSWAEEFLNIYSEYQKAVKTPHIGIVDFIGNEKNTEFEEFKRVFNSLECSCEIYDIRELKFEDGALKGRDGKRIDAIYRRAVTCDIMEKYDQVQAFIEAVKADAVCLIGDFKTQIAHDKVIFKVLRDRRTLSFLSDYERKYVMEHIPYTTDLNTAAIKEHDVLENKDAWVIKPRDLYASKGVHAGVEVDDDKWRELVLANAGQNYLLQEYCTPYETENYDLLYDEHAPRRLYSNITGMFVYGGKMRGLYSRIAKNSIISTQYSEMSLPTIIVSEKKAPATAR